MLREDLQNRFDILTRPGGSLGFLEAIAANMTMMRVHLTPRLHHHWV
jgi:NaMN:DMB phosphoribosyltransferase